MVTISVFCRNCGRGFAAQIGLISHSVIIGALWTAERERESERRGEGERETKRRERERGGEGEGERCLTWVQ